MHNSIPRSRSIHVRRKGLPAGVCALGPIVLIDEPNLVCVLWGQKTLIVGESIT